MLKLNKAEALHYVERNAAVIDALSNPRNPFGTSVWLHHFIGEVVRDDWTLLVPEAVGDGCSLMLLYLDPAAPSRCRSLANFYTSLYSPLASTAADRSTALVALAREISTARPRLSTVTFEPLDADSAETTVLGEALVSQGWFVRRYARFGNWTLPCEGLSFDRYMASRDSQLRNTYQRKAKKLLGSGTIKIATKPEEVDAAMTAYETIYAQSWKRPEPYPNFARGWAQQCAEQGWLRLGVARIDDVPIAAQLWFVYGRRAYIFKLAYDESQSRWSAGTVLTAHMMRHVLEVDRVVEVDFLSGDDPYKKSWMMQRRERVGLIACNLRLLPGLIAAASEFVGQATARLRARP